MENCRKLGCLINEMRKFQGNNEALVFADAKDSKALCILRMEILASFKTELDALSFWAGIVHNETRISGQEAGHLNANITEESLA